MNNELVIYSFNFLPYSTGTSPKRIFKKKPYKYWDVAAAGFEHLTALQYKAMQGERELRE